MADSTAKPRGGKADYARAAWREAMRDRRFAPRLLPTLAAALLIPLFIALGQWQWDKAAAKGNLRALLDARGAEPSVRLPASAVDAESLRYRRVVARGEWEPARQILIDNRVHRERAGYHVLTPLRIDGSPLRVLVNRGWVPALPEHHRVPAIATPGGTVEITGTAIVPGTRFFTLGAEAPADGPWRAVWQNLDLARYRAAVDFPLHPVVVQMAPDSAGGGFAREWPHPDERIERHLGYALQWWSFAATTALIWLFVNFRRK